MQAKGLEKWRNLRSLLIGQSYCAALMWLAKVGMIIVVWLPNKIDYTAIWWCEILFIDPRSYILHINFAYLQIKSTVMQLLYHNCWFLSRILFLPVCLVHSPLSTLFIPVHSPQPAVHVYIEVVNTIKGYWTSSRINCVHDFYIYVHCRLRWMDRYK